MNTLTDGRHEIDIDALQSAWQAFDAIARIRPLDSETEYQHAAALLRQIWDVVGESDHHPLGSLLGILSSMVDDYEKNHHSLGKSEAHEMLTFLMEQGQHTADVLEGILDHDELAAVLAGRRKIDEEMGRRLAVFFGVPAKLFLTQG